MNAPISTRDISILGRVARLVIHDHIGERFNLAVEKLSTEETKAIALDMNSERKSPVGRKILRAILAQYESPPKFDM